MNRNAVRTLLLVLALTGLASCASTGSAPRAPDAVALDADLQPIDRIPSSQPASDADFDGADEAIEALSESTKGERRNPWHRFTIVGAAMVASNFDTSIRVDSKKLGEGVEIKLEDLLGLDDRASMLRIGLQYRFNRHHMLAFGWYDIERTGEQKIQQDIQIGDEVFPAGAEVQTGLDTEIFKLNYWWNFVAEEDWELGVGLGVYWMRVDASFRGRLAAGEEQFDETVEESVKVDLPPPLLGLRGAWAITDRLRLVGSAELLYVPIDAFEGWIFDANLGVNWDILDFAGIGLGYNYFKIGVEADKSGFIGEFNYSYHALLGSIYFYF